MRVLGTVDSAGPGIASGTSFPDYPEAGDLFFLKDDLAEQYLYFYTGSHWEKVQTGTDDNKLVDAGYF